MGVLKQIWLYEILGGILYWYVKIPQCRYMEHRLKYIAFYVQKHIAPLLSHTPLCISMISGVCVQGMWNAEVKGQVTEMHRLKVNSYCDTALFISMYDITMVQP